MSAIDLAIPRLKIDEGFRARVYKDIRGLDTIGYGFCISAGITEHAANALLFAQTQEVQTALEANEWFRNLDEMRQSVMIELAFNNGVPGLLKYIKMIAALTLGDWQDAHDELLDSDAARMLPIRYSLLAKLILQGE